MLKRLTKVTYSQLYILIACLLIAEAILLRDLPFFWDAISKSSRATWIYNNGLTGFILPTEFNSGHPPLWISLLAVSWSLLGKTLLSSRVLLLLVNLGVFYQVIQLCKNNFVKGVAVVASVLVCFEPTLLAQTTSLNNDMLLLFFTLFALNSLINVKPFYYTLALTGLLFANLRGIYLFSALLIIHLFYLKFKLIAKNKSLFYAYVVPVFSFAIFCFIQYRSLGWFLITQNANYSEHRQSAEINNVLVNIAVYVKSFLEYGRFVVFLIGVPLIYKYLRNIKTWNAVRANRIGVAFLVFAIVLFLGMVPFSNPIGSRYFMICYILAIVFLINVLYISQFKYKKTVFASVLFCFLSGHFWIYPATLSQPWDASLAYLRYYSLEEKIEEIIAIKGLKPHQIGTRIRLNERDFSTLKPLADDKKYAEFNLKTNPYILLSNVENYTKDEELLEVQNTWVLVEEITDYGVFLALYKNPNFK
ncbi:hypothetical protein ACW5R3_07625 [Bizionia sp. KMM 8389]